MKASTFFLSSVTLGVTLVKAYAIIDDPNNPPPQTEEGQYGHNDCERYPDSPESKCQSELLDLQGVGIM